MLVKTGTITLSNNEVQTVLQGQIPDRVAQAWPEVSLEELKQLATTQANSGETH